MAPTGGARQLSRRPAFAIWPPSSVAPFLRGAGRRRGGGDPDGRDLLPARGPAPRGGRRHARPQLAAPRARAAWRATSCVDADAIVWVFAVGQAAKATESEALALAHAAGKRVLGVLNKIDRAERRGGRAGLGACRGEPGRSGRGDGSDLGAPRLEAKRALRRWRRNGDKEGKPAAKKARAARAARPTTAASRAGDGAGATLLSPCARAQARHRAGVAAAVRHRGAREDRRRQRAESARLHATSRRSGAR